MSYLFGTKKRKLLDSIIKDSDSRFSKWCIIALLQWENTLIPNNIIKINGSKDKILPSKNTDYLIENAGHLMIVDRAKEVSEILNQLLA